MRHFFREKGFFWRMVSLAAAAADICTIDPHGWTRVISGIGLHGMATVRGAEHLNGDGQKGFFSL